MGIESISVPPLNLGDPAVLEKALGQIDPSRVLGDLGFASKEIQEIFAGDYSAAKEKSERPRVIEFEKVYDSYLKDMNPEIIKSFFTHARDEVEFSEEEAEAFSETYSRFFKRVFDDFQSLVFRYEKYPHVRCLLMKVEDDTYHLSIDDGVGAITYLEA